MQTQLCNIRFVGSLALYAHQFHITQHVPKLASLNIICVCTYTLYLHKHCGEVCYYSNNALRLPVAHPLLVWYQHTYTRTWVPGGIGLPVSTDIHALHFQEQGIG